MADRGTKSRKRLIGKREQEIELELQRCIDHLITADRLQHEIERLRQQDAEFEVEFDRTIALGLLTEQLAGLCAAKLWVVLKLVDVVGEVAHSDQELHSLSGEDPVVH